MHAQLAPVPPSMPCHAMQTTTPPNLATQGPFSILPATPALSVIRTRCSAATAATAGTAGTAGTGCNQTLVLRLKDLGCPQTFAVEAAAAAMVTVLVPPRLHPLHRSASGTTSRNRAHQSILPILALGSTPGRGRAHAGPKAAVPVGLRRRAVGVTRQPREQCEP